MILDPTTQRYCEALVGATATSASKTKRAKKPPKVKLPRTAEPVPCVILAVDPGAQSGWAILDPHGLHDAGEAVEGIFAIVVRAADHAEALGLPLIIVGERWAGKWKHIAQVQGLGASWKTWERALAWARVPAKRIVRVLTQSWRAVVLGGKRSSEEWKAEAVRYARERFDGRELGHDAAEAACMAVWGQHAGEVLAAMPKPRKPAKGRVTKTKGTSLFKERGE